ATFLMSEIYISTVAAQGPLSDISRLVVTKCPEPILQPVVQLIFLLSGLRHRLQIGGETRMIHIARSHFMRPGTLSPIHLQGLDPIKLIASQDFTNTFHMETALLYNICFFKRTINRVCRIKYI